MTSLDFLESSSSDDEDFQRLMILKQMYLDTKQEYESMTMATLNNRRPRPSILNGYLATSSPMVAPSSSSSSSAHYAISSSSIGGSSSSSSSSAYHIHHGLPSSTSSSSLSMSQSLSFNNNNNNNNSNSALLKKRTDSIDPWLLQVVLKQALERHGGSIHIDVAVKYVQDRWPMLRRRNSSILYTTTDFKKYIQNTLRVYKPCKDMFAKDPDRDSCIVFVSEKIEWTDPSPSSRLTRGCPKFLTRHPPTRRRDPISEMISFCLEGKIEGVDIEEIEPFILLNWAVPCPGGIPLECSEIKDTIRIALEYDPIFHCISEDPFIYTLASSLHRPPKRNRLPSDGSDSSAISSPSAHDSGTSSSSSSSSSSHGKRVRANNRRGGSNQHESEPDNPEASDEEKGTWICCDNCGVWLKAEEDGITDISIYDDNNPNHLDYFCPACRKHKRSRTNNQPTATARSAKGGKDIRESLRKTAAANGSRRIPAKQQAPGSPQQKRTRSLSARSGKAAASSKSTPDSDDSDNESDSEARASSIDRLVTLFQELVEEYSLDKKSLEEARKEKAALIEGRNREWKKNREQTKEKIAKLKEQYRQLNRQAEDDLLKKLREQFKQ